MSPLWSSTFHLNSTKIQSSTRIWKWSFSGWRQFQDFQECLENSQNSENSKVGSPKESAKIGGCSFHQYGLCELHIFTTRASYLCGSASQSNSLNSVSKFWWFSPISGEKTKSVWWFWLPNQNHQTHVGFSPEIGGNHQNLETELRELDWDAEPQRWEALVVKVTNS